MKSRTFMIIFIAAIVTLIAFPATSRAVTFPITYSGLMQTEIKFTDGFPSCTGNAKIEITLLADGKLTGQYEHLIFSRHENDNPPHCEMKSEGDIFTVTGSHDFQGNYKIPNFMIFYQVALGGKYNESSINGSLTYGSYSYSFTLQAADQTPKITLEPATYPEFQLNILKGKGFTVKIRKEDGIWDSNGKSKLNFSTLIFATDGKDNSANFINTGANQNIFSVNSDEKEVLLKVTPDPKKFMHDQNVFNILGNGEHKIGFQICDTDDSCGKSEYIIYFGPFYSAKSVTDLRCTSSREESLSIEDIVLGNIGYECPSFNMYYVLINYYNPDEYWCSFVMIDAQGHPSYFWYQGKVVPLMKGPPMPEASLYENPTGGSDLRYCIFSGANAYQPFPAGEYLFFGFAMDLSTGAGKGVFKNVTTCSFP